MAISLKTSTVIALALASVTLPSAVKAATTVNVTTGETVPAGTIDPNWKINGGNAYVGVNLPGVWAGGIGNAGAAGARWIVPGVGGNPATTSGGIIYSTLFSLPNAADLSSARISGQFWADNYVLRIVLNGVNLYVNPIVNLVDSDSNYALNRSVNLTNLSGNFLAGSNTLQVFTRDAGSQEGGMFSFVVTAVPEPATWLLMLMGFGFVGFQMRRRQNTQVRFQFA